MNKYDVLKKYYGYDSFRNGQEMMIDTILSGRDALGIMPTGAGKSICYQVPAMLLPGITLVISPLISLMKDQVQALNQAGIPAAYINSSLTEQQILLALRYAAMGKYKIIYVAPERLLTGAFLRFAQMVEISMLTVDEAHCISQWGQDFRPSYLKIVEFIGELKRRPVISAFTATATEQVREDIVRVLGLLSPEVLVTGFDRKNLYFGVEKPKKKDAYILKYIKEHERESGIIYCATRKNVDALHELLLREQVPVTKYHAGLSGEERMKNQEDFIYDRSPVMVATNAFGMGIDKSNVRYVLHYNMPQSLENYYQEAGRAGRDGEPSECILLYSGQDMVVNRYLLQGKEENEELSRAEQAAVRERDEERLQDMSYYCLTTDCQRSFLLTYFGEEGHGACGNCSNCREEFEETDITEQAVQIISCIREMRQRYGINVVAGTLAGSERAKLKEYGVKALEAYGKLRGTGEEEIKQMINTMLVDRILCMSPDKYALLQLSEQAWEVLQGKRRVLWKKSGTAKREDVVKKIGSRTASKARKSDLLNSRGLELFEELRKLRTQLAKEEGMPPYIIFSDKSLVDMCVKAPFDKEEMLKVSGVGEYKFQKYGEQFVDKILEFTSGRREKFYFGESSEGDFQESGRQRSRQERPWAEDTAESPDAGESLFRVETGMNDQESSFRTEQKQTALEWNTPGFKVIAHIYTDFPEKFGIPRQSGLVKDLKGKIVFEPEYRSPEAVRGLEEFDYLWLLWQFEGTERQQWSPTVKPPRLGGNTHMGVFATRSPFRPNPIGLSSVRLERVEITAEGPVLYVSGIDLRDRTPIYDIKPYLSYADSHPDARNGFAGHGKDYELEVEFPEELLNRFPEEKRTAVYEVLRQDPRPSYHQDPERTYGVAFAGYDIHFRVEEKKLSVFEVVPYHKK